MKGPSQAGLLQFKQNCEMELKSHRMRGIVSVNDSTAVIKELLLAKIIWNINERWMASDGPVSHTHDEITDAEIRRIYTLAGGNKEAEGT